MKTALDFYSSQENNQDVATTIPVSPTRSGYVFRGWSEVSNDYVAGNRVQLPKVYNADQTLYAMWVETPADTITITGFGEQNPNNIVYVLDDNVKALIADIIAGNYDEDDVYGNHFVRYPTFYRKILTSSLGQITSIAISTTQLTSDYEPYTCFVKPDRVTVMPYVLVGKSIWKNATIGSARTDARNIGTGYQLLDWQIFKMLQDLGIGYYKTINPTNNPYLGLSGWNGGLWIDGVCKNNTQWLFAYDPANYRDSPTSSSTGYNVASYASPSSSGVTKVVGYDSNHPFFNFCNAVGGSSTEYYKANFNYGSGNKPVFSSVLTGVWGCSAHYDWSYTTGVRLCYRPIA